MNRRRRRRFKKTRAKKLAQQLPKKFKRPKPPKATRPCFFCAEQISITKITKDHLQPKSRGGGNGENLVDACQPCNNDKASLTLDEYRLVVAFRRGIIQGVVMPFPGELAS